MTPEELLKDKVIENVKTKKTKLIGIYIIYCQLDNKAYVGQSRNIYSRINEHKRDLSYKRHKNPHLTNIYKKYGAESLTYMILELCEKEKLLERETYFYNLLDSTRRINAQPPYDMRSLTEREIAKRVSKVRGRAFPEASKLLISQKLKGRVESKETREKKSMAMWGRIQTEEQKAKTMVNLSKQWEKFRGQELPEEWYKNRKYKQLTIEEVRTIKKDLDLITEKEAAIKYDLQLKTVRGLKKRTVWNKQSIV